MHGDRCARPESLSLADLLRRRAALVVAHPGHELRVHGWLEQARPQVFVLTDGSGPTDTPRLDATTRILERVGATAGPVYGRFSDAAFYAALLRRKPAPFVRLARELAAAFLRSGVGAVVGDAVEGYSPAHDVCRLLIDAAVRLAHRRGLEIVNLAFPLLGPPDGGRGGPAVRLALDRAALARKLAAARAYPGLAAEVETALRRWGAAAFAVECLRPSARLGGGGIRPLYEDHGRRRVAAGRYREVITYRGHVAPVARALARAVEEQRTWAGCAS